MKHAVSLRVRFNRTRSSIYEGLLFRNLKFLELFNAGMGRISSRVARRRIANVNPNDDTNFGDEDDFDIWSTKAKRPKNKRNGSPKLTKKILGKVKNDLSGSPQGVYYLGDPEGSDRASFEALSPQSKERFLKTTCGVISEVSNSQN